MVENYPHYVVDYNQGNAMTDKNILKWLKQIDELLEGHNVMGSILAQEKVKRLIKRIKKHHDL